MLPRLCKNVNNFSFLALPKLPNLLWPWLTNTRKGVTPTVVESVDSSDSSLATIPDSPTIEKIPPVVGSTALKPKSSSFVARFTGYIYDVAKLILLSTSFLAFLFSTVLYIFY